MVGVTSVARFRGNRTTRDAPYNLRMARRPDIDQAVEHLAKYATREPWLAHRREHFERTRLAIAPADERELTGRMDALADWTREQEGQSAWVWQPDRDDEMRMIHATARLQGGPLAVLRESLGTLVGAGLTSHEDPAHLLRHGAPRAVRGESTEPPLEGPEIDGRRAVRRKFNA
jgi:hypothetical protein